jgi:acetyl-CoA carboxylase carboxyl transferase subunit beta
VSVEGSSTVTAPEVAVSGGVLPAVNLPLACPGCGIVTEPDRVRRQLYTCDCGHHFRMHAEAWIALLASPGTWQEHWAELEPRDRLGWNEPRPYGSLIADLYRAGLNEAVRTGTCWIGRHQVWLTAFDFRFIGGTMGVVSGERLAQGLERAAQLRLPYVLVSASGGARMQEGTLALLQMAKVNAALWRLKDAACPFVSILTDPTFGGTAASLSLLGDVNVAEPEALIGFTGARVIKQATHATLPQGFQNAEFQLAHGQVDLVVPRRVLRQTIVQLLGFFERGVSATPDLR